MSKGFVKKTLAKLGVWAHQKEFALKQSSAFSLREDAPRLFYPGCSLVAADPNLSAKVSSHLKTKYQDMGVWFDCCGMPLRKFADSASSTQNEDRLARTVKQKGIKEIITACGNCTLQLKRITDQNPDLKITSLYDVLADEDWPELKDHREYTVHHPCSSRMMPELQTSFYRLTDKAEIQVKNKMGVAHPLACCLVTTPSANKKREALKDEELLTYCGHCTQSFQKDIATRHVLQVLFGSEYFMKRKNKLQRFANYLKFKKSLINQK